MVPLLEETRAALCASMDGISEAPIAAVTLRAESKHNGSILYEITVNSWKKKLISGSKEAYKPMPEDIFVLSDIIPETFSDLQRYGRPWTFAAVTKAPDNEQSEDSSFYLKVKAGRDIEFKEGMQKSLFAVFLTNLTTNYRIWFALHGMGKLKIMEYILGDNVMAEKCCNICTSVVQDGILAERSEKGISSGLNESQTGAVVHSMSAMQCNHKFSVKLISGPPGTAKTLTVSALLWSSLVMKHRTGACAPTNIAVKELASRALKMFKRFRKTEYGVNRTCYSLGDVLLFGNKDHLELDNDLGEIFLDYRVDRLVESFGRLRGWQHHFTLMIYFLENELSQVHESYRDNEPSKAVLSLLELTRKWFKAVAQPLGECVRALFTHLPKHLILPQNIKLIASLLYLLESLEILLCNDDVVHKELEEFCLHSEEVFIAAPPIFKLESESVNCSKSVILSKIRKHCLCALRSLHDSLINLDLPPSMNKDSIREFWFQSASLIFCTTSSSYKLHSIVMEPLNLLVIDEAAQLKECESAIPLQLPGIRHAILIGDECQLPAMVDSKVSGKAVFGRSLFERLILLKHPNNILSMQYRMHPEISIFPNTNFYCNQILDAPSFHDKSYNRHYLPGPMYGPYSFINIPDGREVLEDVGHSPKNLVELAVVMKILRNLFKALPVEEVFQS
ncbi:uncharacterized protein LOC122070235 isoform X2 [Macadamia integrifolia]|uniref:uncharacterized protein LOC122070235 isoform X2 n=1 Tax=Macadamia integrifolia TaxID=60698 RepID=UPI001C4F6720|nr:uncharacterized protein LOC122070235 isoform X2 [Macadamia integrifolia]